MSDFLRKINPFYKFIFIVLFSTILTFLHHLWVNVVVFAMCILLLFVGSRISVFLRACKIMIPILILAFSLFMSGMHFGVNQNPELGSITFENTQTGLLMSVRLLAFASMGLILALTTDSYDLVKSLQSNGRIPRKFAYGMICAVNLLPYIKKEYHNTRLAFMVRGQSVGLLSLRPIFSMLVNCFQWSEVLSMAMISKGFDEST